MTDQATPGEDLELENYLHAERKRRKRIALIVAGTTICAIGVVALWLAMRPEPRCDEKDARSFLSHRNIPAGVASQVCRFDSPIGDALRDMESSPPGMQDLFMAKAIADARDPLERICPGAVNAIVSDTQTGGSQALAQACDLSSIGVSRDDARRYSAQRLAFALLVYDQLADSDEDLAKPIARAVLTR